jgi:hypothetical protein
VIEVHLLRLEPPAAVGARDTAEVTQQLEGRALSCDDPIDLAPSISLVVLDVVWPLIACSWHSPEHEQSFEPRQ